MLVSCWSAKGGSGCSVLTASLALAWSRAGREVLLVDLCGDLPAVLGVADDGGDGLAAWLAAGADVPADGLARLEVQAAPGVALIPRGTGPADDVARHELLAGLLAAGSRLVIADVGLVEANSPHLAYLSEARHSLLVVRPCFLALQRLSTMTTRPTGVLLLDEPGRALDRSDVEQVTGAPVVASVMADPAVARAVDAGLLARRPPRALERALQPVLP